MNKKHIWPFAVLTVFILLLISLPFFFAWRAGGESHQFIGPLFNYYDGNSYLAKMRQGWGGGWQFQLPYTTDPGSGTYLFPFYIFLGHIARLTGWSLPFTFHFFRLAAALLMLVMLYRFCLWVFGEQGRKGEVAGREKREVAGSGKLAFTLAAVGSGVGWLALPFGGLTSDLWVAEAYPFLSAYANVHFPFGLALQLWLLMLPARLSWRRALAVVVVSALAAAAAPFTPPVTLVVLGGLLAWKMLCRQPFKLDMYYIGLVVLGSAPVLSYYYFTSLAHPVLSIWNAQNETPTPALWDLLVSFSPALLLAIPGARAAWRETSGRGRLVAIWAGLSLLLVYVPFPLQRRFLGGLFVPLTILAAFALHAYLDGRPKRRGLVLAAVFILVVPTNLISLATGFAGAGALDERLYLSNAEAQTFAWIDQNLPPNVLILASPQIGLFLPSYTDSRVLYGHPFETANAEAMEAIVTDFFATPVDTVQAQEFWHSYQVDYLFYGPRERELGALPWLTDYEPIFVGGDVALYWVGTE